MSGLLRRVKTHEDATGRIPLAVCTADPDSHPLCLSTPLPIAFAVLPTKATVYFLDLSTLRLGMGLASSFSQ